ncbi:uncharacterized protein BO66DRAFT_183747 [Aspergillus aculeatinus CBS 121060]|uniref:Uncharacterized protein n=1 Tax=Aspergillus aculeatinus CBS 121060 TaxID=1448322 RepID=A0ACD1GYA5_9EURO|nr:hypothetical protein BO66DRAFT_183747 [Aspergillus aculeatinus CBS 121060]RAH66326.1 hypothetical protein BO66DRAFT_183747 [Aspergillus aculeatinus CBS 121060]
MPPGHLSSSQSRWPPRNALSRTQHPPHQKLWKTGVESCRWEGYMVLLTMASKELHNSVQKRNRLRECQLCGVLFALAGSLENRLSVSAASRHQLIRRAHWRSSLEREFRSVNWLYNRVSIFLSGSVGGP